MAHTSTFVLINIFTRYINLLHTKKITTYYDLSPFNKLPRMCNFLKTNPTSESKHVTRSQKRHQMLNIINLNQNLIFYYHF
jgi:hypothetical protein